MTTEWQPTHRITFTATGELEIWEVMLVEESAGNGPAYTREEWGSDDSSAWGLSDGAWLCEGQPTPAGCAGTVSVEAL